MNFGEYYLLIGLIIAVVALVAIRIKNVKKFGIGDKIIFVIYTIIIWPVFLCMCLGVYMGARSVEKHNAKYKDYIEDWDE